MKIEKKSPFCIWVLIIIPLLLISCFTTSDDPSSIPKISRPTWSEYYQRGLAYAYLHDWEKAKADFKAALGLDAKKRVLFPEFEERYWARAYGLHFVRDYFPHRELGISHYYLGNLEDAERELLTSIEMLPSSRAKFFLNKVRAETVTRSKETHGKIELVNGYGKRVIYVNSDFATLENIAIYSPFFISKLEVNEIPINVDIAVANYQFNSTQTFPVGSNETQIQLTAWDLGKNTQNWTFNLIRDLEGPSIAYDQIKKSHNTYSFDISISDNQALSEIHMGSEIIRPEGEEIREYNIIRELAGGATFKIRVVDKAGNITSDDIDVDRILLLEQSMNWLKLDSPIAIASSIPMAFNPTQTELLDLGVDSQIQLLPRLQPLKNDMLECNKIYTRKLDIKVINKDLSIEFVTFYPNTDTDTLGKKIYENLCENKSKRYKKISLPITFSDQKSNIAIKVKNCGKESKLETYCVVKEQPLYFKHRISALLYHPFAVEKRLKEAIDDNILYKKIYDLLKTRQDRLQIGPDLVDKERVNPEEYRSLLNSKDYWFIKCIVHADPSETDEGWTIKLKLSSDLKSGEGFEKLISRNDEYFNYYDDPEQDQRLKSLVDDLINDIPQGFSEVVEKKSGNKILISSKGFPKLQKGMVFWFTEKPQDYDLESIDFDSLPSRKIKPHSDQETMLVRAVVTRFDGEHGKRGFYEAKALSDGEWKKIKIGDLAILF